jgi:cell division protein FtsW
MAQRLRTDWTLFFTVVALAFFGLVMIYSASIPKAEAARQASVYFAAKQFLVTAAGMAVMMFLKNLDYRVLRKPVWAFAPLGLVVMALVAVYFLDSKTHRWVRVAGFQLQPSEFAKPALALFLAWFVSRRLSAINSKYTVGPAAMVLALLAALVLAGDLGTMLLLLIMAAAVFFVAGISRKYFAIACAGVMLLGIAGVVSKPYRLRRAIYYADPDGAMAQRFDWVKRLRERSEASLATKDARYQQRQSIIAVGSGGVLGLGLMQGRQKMLYVPEAHTDFIYAVIGEELGLWGCSGVLIGYLVILWRGLRLFWTAPDDFGRYLSLAIIIALVAQALINVSVVLDLGPTKGFPLPLISYGGSSMLSTLLSFGLVLSVSERSA